jgi:hypothetical protein
LLTLAPYLQVYESNAFEEEGEDNLPVGTITLLDPQQQQQVDQQVPAETKHKKRKGKIPYQSQFAHLAHVIFLTFYFQILAFCKRVFN